MNIKSLATRVPKDEHHALDRSMTNDAQIHNYEVDEVLYGRYSVTEDGKELVVAVQDQMMYRIPLEQIAMAVGKIAREDHISDFGVDLPVLPKKEFTLVKFLREARDRFSKQESDKRRARQELDSQRQKMSGEVK